jgi:hypothetical protein
VKPWLTQGVFPPQARQNRKKKNIKPEQLSLWRELKVALTLVVVMLLADMNNACLTEQLGRLSAVCADSKRKRLSQVSFLSSA